MATSFERAKSVIDALFPIAKRRVKRGTVEDMVKSRLRGLSQAYGGKLLKSGRNPVDYTMTTTHIAYTYRCLGAHADWIFKALCLARRAVEAALSGKTARVSAIGGGPGSDIAGILKFAGRYGLNKTKFEFVILDREQAWDTCREQLTATFRQEFDVDQRFQALDLAAGKNWTSSWEFCEADLFTFSFSLSEVWSFNDQGSVTAFLNEVIGRAKKGALFCYVDNGGHNFTPLVEKHFSKRKDLELLGSDESERMLLSSDEQCDVLSDYRAKFGQFPKLTGNVALRIWKKL